MQFPTISHQVPVNLNEIPNKSSTVQKIDAPRCKSQVNPYKIPMKYSCRMVKSQQNPSKILLNPYKITINQCKIPPRSPFEAYGHVPRGGQWTRLRGGALVPWPDVHGEDSHSPRQ